MHPRYAPFLFGFLVSGLMSFIVTGIATLRIAGLSADLPEIWVGHWLSSWAVAFPAVLVVAPIVRAVVARLVRAPDAGTAGTRARA